MYISLYRLRLKCLFKKLNLIAILFLLPITISTLFFIGFYRAEPEQEDMIRIAFVEGEAIEDIVTYFEEVNQIQDSVMDYSVHTMEKARELISLGRLDALISLGNNPVLYMGEDGAKQDMIRGYLNSYLRYKKEGSISFHEDKIGVDLVQTLELDKKRIDNSSFFFYTMLALTCLLGSKLQFVQVAEYESGDSSLAQRIKVSSIHRGRLFLSNILAVLTVQTLSVGLLLLYYIQVLEVIPKQHRFLLLIICFVGSILGICLGSFVHSENVNSHSLKTYIYMNKSIKQAILNIILFGGSFLSGIVFLDVRYYVMKEMPILTIINPVALITDAFYYLYHYEYYQKVYLNIGLLIAWSILIGCFILVQKIRSRRFINNG